MENWEQLDLFGRPEIRIDKKIKLIEMFAGYGSQAMALERMGVEFETHYVCEFDGPAIKSYNAVHNTNYETKDIRDVHGSDLNITDKDKYCYILTYSFPCTDLSLAGKGAGLSKEDWENGNSTRSGLLWEVERIIKELVADKKPLPDVLLMENVPQVISPKFMDDFQKWLQFLYSIGYYSTYEILNAKNFGVAQSRERCFMLSFFGEDYKYTFPHPIELKKKLKDYLEPEVEDKYYLKSEKAEQLINQLVSRGVLDNQETEQNRTEQNNRGRLTSLSTIQTSRKSQTVSQPEKTGESALNSQKEPALLNYRRVDEVGNETAKTLMARDYKGFGSGYDTQNGVIEKE